MPNRKRRRSSSDIANLKDGKQQKIDKFVANTQSGEVYLSNRYAVLEPDSQALPGEEERDTLAEIDLQQHCCQQLPTMIMELFSKEALLTSQSLAILFDKINAIDVKIKNLEEAVRNFAVARPTGGRVKIDAEVIQTNETAAGNLQPAKEVLERHQECSSLILQKNLLAISFNSQTDYFRWRNFNMIILSLSQLLNCRTSEILLSSYYRLPRTGAFSRVVLQFKNENIPAKMMSLQSLLFHQYGIWVTRVFKNNVCTSLRPKTLILEKPKGKVDVSTLNKKLGSSSALEPGSLEYNKRREIKLGMTSKLPPCDGKHTEMATQDGLEKTHYSALSYDSNSHKRPREEYSEAEVPHRQKKINCQKGVTHEWELDLRAHQVVAMPSGAPINAKSLALELMEAEAEQVRVQQIQSILMDGMPKEMEGNLILPTSSTNGEQLPHSINKGGPDTLVQQDDEGVPLVPLHQGGMLDNSIEDALFTMFEDLTPQEQHAVTERLEHTECFSTYKHALQKMNSPFIQVGSMTRWIYGLE